MLDMDKIHSLLELGKQFNSDECGYYELYHNPMASEILKGNEEEIKHLLLTANNEDLQYYISFISDIYIKYYTEDMGQFLDEIELKYKKIFLMECINDSLKELNEYWDAYSDPRLKGEHPDCIRIQEKLIVLFNKLSDEELLELCKSIEKDKLEQIAYPLEEVSQLHPCVESYIKY